MKSIYFLILSIIILPSCSSNYIIKSNLVSGVRYEELQKMNYSLGSVVEKKEDKKEYSKFNPKYIEKMKQILNEELKKGLQDGISNFTKNNVLVNVYINKNVQCIFEDITSRRTRSFGYHQTGYIFLEIVGIQADSKDKKLFDVDIVYDMDMTKKRESIFRSIACDSDEKMDKIITKDIFPLVVREIGEDRIVKKK